MPPIMTHPCVIAATMLVLILVVGPTFSFLQFGWHARRRDILRSFNDAAILAYFKAFHQRTEHADLPPEERFQKFYDQQYGQARYLTPVVLFALLSFLALYWTGVTVEQMIEGRIDEPSQMPLLAVFAIMGAFMWIIFEGIERWYSNRLPPSYIYRWCLRIVIAVPMAYATKSLVAEGIAPAIAFFIGAFPTSSILTISRRIASQKLGFGDSSENPISELQKLQGIDIRQAERFADEGVTTILQLAYCDPIQMTIRTGLTYAHVSDCVCQAILWIYFEDKKQELLKQGLRSSYEVASLWRDCVSAKAADRCHADKVISQAAAAIGYPEESFRNVLCQVALDLHTDFLFENWTGNNERISPAVAPSSPPT